ATGEGDVVAEVPRIACHDGDVAAVPADEDMGGASAAQAADERDLVLELRPERIDENGLQPCELGPCAQVLRQLARIDGAVVDDGEVFGCPAVDEYVGHRLALGVRARSEPEYRPA